MGFKKCGETKKLVGKNRGEKPRGKTGGCKGHKTTNF
jgi:hypothetical protein